MKKINTAKDLEKLKEKILKSKSNKQIISICKGTACYVYDSEKIVKELKKEIKKHNLEIEIRATGCHGFCARGPILIIYPEGIFYQKVRPENIKEIISETIIKNKILENLLYQDPLTQKKIIYEKDISFYKKQYRPIFGNNKFINPENIEDYIGIGGYSALVKVLTLMKPIEVIEEIKKSNLRGRGGGGFSTGKKWESCRKAEEKIKYIVCNADEGDPGAYMDGALLEGNPHSVLEGMIIGAYAIGASEGYVYIRNEYPLALKNLQIAINQCEKYGLLGKNILNSGFDFKIKINRGGGAFVCGESTALIASLEGKVGRPKAKFIHTAERGLYDKPTNINNVETWANVPLIINKGADWYSKIGTENSKGTKIFSLVGKINNTGLIEIPMGISLREIIYNIGGGILSNKRFKAVQTGGPSGGVIPENLLDFPVDFDKLQEIGSMMGSGGMIVMDEETCMVDVAKYFINFLKDESCGKCTVCREGIKRLLQILTSICEGEAEDNAIDLLEELSYVIKDSSLCALGSTAPNPILSTIKYFKDEYKAHIKEKKCPAKVCTALIKYNIVVDKCKGCGECIKKCPQQALTGKLKEIPKLEENKCSKCGICFEVCKLKAITKN